MKLFTLCFFTFSVLASSLLAQDSATSASRSELPGISYALALYDSATVESPHLYNGQQYYIYDSQSQEHQFFLSEEWRIGSVSYDGQLFKSVPLLYDVFKDQVVVKYTKGVGNVALQSEKVSDFSFADHTFVRIEAGQPQAGGLRTGFYDMLYEGKTRLLARRVKDRLQQIEDTRITIEYPTRDVYYLLKNGEYRVVHSRQSVLAYLEDQKKPLKKHLRDNKLSFRYDREGAIKALVSYYDQLTKP